MDQTPLALPLPATRAAGLARLNAFLPRAGTAYARDRNRDLPGHRGVSGLSPWTRHRLVLEQELVDAAWGAHGHDAEKFISEAYWRTYWNGWLEMRPIVWRDYQRGVEAGLNRVATEAGFRKEWEAACQGRTGIDAFDHWAEELVATGYMHNHARMWFASIWIFTLRLPWELGADFFLRHLIDGDPASNTLSWRWVGGLHTPGKTYLATAENIAKNTNGRFRPQGLAKATFPLHARPFPAPRPIEAPGDWDRSLPSALLIHDDDCSPEYVLEQGLAPVISFLLSTVAGRSPLAVAPMVQDFATAALQDAAGRVGVTPAGHAMDAGAVDDLVKWVRRAGVRQVVTPYAPVGPTADALADLARALAPHDITVARVLRDYDRALWPHATHGFFRFREGIG
jgi:deoxyribodipyrimidine photo-lyase